MYDERDNEHRIWNCIVVGAGIEGSNAARFSASLGKTTLCLEQVMVMLHATNFNNNS